MNLAETQHILARLYTDQEYRNDFLKDRSVFYNYNKLTDPDTIAFLEAINAEQLNFFAQSLYQKRFHEVLHVIPGVACLLKKEAGPLFKAFHQVYKPSGIHKHHEEALAFIEFIKTQKKYASHFQTILKFEAIRIRQFTSPRNWKIAFFTYNPIIFLNALQAGQEPIIKKGLTCILFKKGKIHDLYQI